MKDDLDEFLDKLAKGSKGDKKDVSKDTVSTEDVAVNNASTEDASENKAEITEKEVVINDEITNRKNELNTVETTETKEKETSFEETENKKSKDEIEIDEVQEEKKAEKIELEKAALINDETSVTVEIPEQMKNELKNELLKEMNENLPDKNEEIYNNQEIEPDKNIATTTINFDKNAGREIPKNEVVVANNAPFSQQLPPANEDVAKIGPCENYKVTSLVLGICSIVFSGIPILSTVGAMCAIIFGTISIIKTDSNNGKAVAGIITACFGLILSIVIVPYMLIFYMIQFISDSLPFFW